MKRDEKPSMVDKYIEMERERVEEFWRELGRVKKNTPYYTKPEPLYWEIVDEDGTSYIAYNDNAYTHLSGGYSTGTIPYDTLTGDNGLSYSGNTLSLDDIRGGGEITLDADLSTATLKSLIEETLEEHGIIQPKED